MTPLQLKCISRIFEFIHELKISTNKKHYYNDLFDRLYDMEIDELQQYEYDMECEKQFREEEQLICQ